MKYFLIAISGLALTLAILLWAVTLPPVQSWLVANSTWMLKRQLKADVSLESVSVQLPYYVGLDGVILNDQRGEKMIEAESIKVDFITFSLSHFFFNREDVQEVVIRDVILVKPRFLLTRFENDSLNLQFLLDRFKKDKSNPNPIQWKIRLSSIQIENGWFAYKDLSSTDSVASGKIDPKNLELEAIFGTLGLTKFPSNRLEIQISNASAKEPSTGFTIQELSTIWTEDTLEKWDADQTCEIVPYVLFEDVILKAGGNQVYGRVYFPGAEIKTLFDSTFSEYLELQIATGSQLNFDSLNSWLKKDLPLHGVMGIRGSLWGTMDHLRGKGVQGNFGDSSRVDFDMDLKGILEPETAQLGINVSQGYIEFKEVANLLPSVNIPQLLLRMNQLRISGEFFGGIYDFDIKANLLSKLGSGTANLHLELPPFSKQITYKGKVEFNQLDVDALRIFPQKISKQLTAGGTIEGTGVKIGELSGLIDMTMAKSYLMGYYFDSLAANLVIKNGEVKGNVKAADKDGYADLALNLSLGNAEKEYNVKGEIANINLATYKIYPEVLRLSTQLDFHAIGDSLENLNGEVKLRETQMEKQDSTILVIPDLWVNSNKNTSDYKYINLKSKLLDADIAGNFTFRRAIKLTQRLAYESKLYFTNDDSLIQAYYLNKVSDSTEIDVRFGIATRDSINQIFSLLDIPLYLAPGGLFTGGLQFGLSEQAEVRFQIDSADFNGVGGKNMNLDINLIKIPDANSLAITGGIHMDDFFAGPRFKLKEVALDVAGLDNEFESDFVAEQGVNNRAQIKLLTTFRRDGSIRSSIDPSISLIKVQQDTLRFDVGDSIIYDQHALDIRNLILQNRNGYLRLDGIVSKNPESTMNVEVAQLGLDIIDDLYPVKYDPGGKFNASLQLKNLFNDPEVSLISRIDKFKLDGFDYGQVHLWSKWKQSSQEIDAHASLWNGKDTTLTLNGSYVISDTISPLSCKLATQEGFPLNFIYPFVKTQLYGIEGKVELDDFSINGRLDNLTVKGLGHFEKAGFGIDYFKTKYTFDGTITFDNDRITFPRIQLYDKNRNHADFYGVIRHRGMREFEFDLQLDEVNNFLIMDTHKGDNDLFYGTLYIKDGIADVTGNLEHLDIQAIASSGPNSKLYIPVSYDSDLERPDFIHFVGEEELGQQRFNTGLQGFELNLTAIATQDAQVDLIFDERTGDIIRGRGDGTISLRINEDGEFNMFGEYEISEGDYLFTAQNVINKKFQVKPGGNIVWSGDPYGANIKMDAFYPLYADIKDLLQEEQTIRAPVNVLMHMEGLLLQPEISLSIELPNLNQGNAASVVSYLKTIQYDEQELNKQVFSLMVFNRFAPVGGFFVDETGGSSVVTTSVSELLSNQLNYWLSRVINDKLSVNVGTSNFQDVNLLVSAKLFNDRVTIERDGTLVGTNSNFSVGNISLIIKLLPKDDPAPEKGRPSELVLEVFNRENIDIDLHNNSYRTGVGIFFKKDFDKIGQLFQKKKKE